MNIYITGITGTVGRAFVELLETEHNVTGIDRNEQSVAQFQNDFPDVKVEVGDFVGVDFRSMNIDLLIHLAAMKHVDLCATNVNQCVLNNVVKTCQLLRSAHSNNVKILFMSTDKAVEPISPYGYSKALGEGMALELGGSIIRSGNIVGSNGSVEGIWEEAIQNKQPIKITHKKMHRYFISPENLAKRAWKLYLSGEKVIIPEMDRDIYLVDLAKEKLAEHGFTLEDYPHGVEYIGLRPGEKLKEKLK